MITFRWEKQGVPQSPQSLRNHLFLVDERGWLYDSVAWASAGSGDHAEDELNHYAFTSFPRWQRTIDLVLLEPDAKGPPPRLTLSNPAFLERPLTNWPAQSLPQVLSTPNVRFRLNQLHPKGAALYNRRIQSAALHSPRRWTPEIESLDADGTSNAWHVVRHSFYDNYGNHSLNGMPHRVAGDTPSALQWRLEVTMAADDRSIVASNRFWELPAHSMPGAGMAHSWGGTNRHWPDLELQFGAFAGPGTVIYTNGYLSGVERADRAPAGRSLSSSTTTHGTNQVDSVRATMPYAHVAFLPYGPGATNYHYSCRLIDEISGEALWLGSYNQPSKLPEFIRLFTNNNQPLIFSCESLDTNRAYRILVGIHPVRTIEFLCVPPELPEY